jgi:hypothetical protein
MRRPRLLCKPTPTQTRLMLMDEQDELLRAALPPPWPHPSPLRAAPMLCEALALWLQRPLCVVLGADEPDGLSALGLCDDLGFGVTTLHYEVEVVDPRHRRPLGSFRDLRQLDLRGLR